MFTITPTILITVFACLIVMVAILFFAVKKIIKGNNIKNSEFLATVCHDLRSPMASISGFATALSDGTIPTEKQKHYLDIISNETKRLSRLVNSLVDISQFDLNKGNLQKSKFDICETLRQTAISIETRINDNNVNVIFDFASENCIVYADSDKIHQVIYNLCDNALKFCDDNGTLKLSVKKDNDRCSISVYNSGQGIPKDDMINIFDKFFKSKKHEKNNIKGIGLGLYISKAIIDMHKEKIYVTSKENEYCMFTFTLPYGN